MCKWMIAVLLLLPSAAWAQHAGDKEITGQIGWQYGGTQDFVNSLGFAVGDFHANANLNYGGMFTFFPRDYYAIEIQYSYQSTDLIARPSGAPNFKLGDMATQYIHLYGTRDVPFEAGRVDGFAMGGLGATVYSADGYDTRWLFSVGAGVGAKIHMNERTALRLQTRLLFPVQWSGTGFYFGSGGAGISVGGGSTLIQGDVSLGLVIKLGSS